MTFRPLSAELVEAYLESGEWEGRAGAYAIQGLGGRLVERIGGDYLNVVGLPATLHPATLPTAYTPPLAERLSSHSFTWN